MDAAAVHLRLLLYPAGHLPGASGCWCRCTPSPPTRRAECLSSPLWCWSPAARCCCSPCAGTGSRVNNALWSRESLLLGNNVLLMVAMLVVLLGTLPLVHKQLGLGISVGSCFFNTMFTG
ncbi:hypothetical protein DOE62_08130 [Salmonella enterica subsp. enterica serovar Brandenburg]|nr:hypothetical protein DOE62_08130 [Salmonella enterica subsp. enterica serovar Brandenburg]